MALFTSHITDKEPILTNRNYQAIVREAEQAGYCGGYIERDYSAEPIGTHGFAAPFPKELLIPRSEWRDRIEAMEKTKSRLSDLIRYKKLPYQDQANTNYCWIFGTVAAIHIVRMLQGEPMVMLSPASVGAPLTNYANARGNPAGVGGWGTKALAYIVKHGIAPADLWPIRAIDKRYDNAESQAARKAYNVTEWYDVPPNSFDHLMSIVLRGLPAPIGIPWGRGGHLICACDPVVRGRDSFAVRPRNSWANYGDDGFFVIDEDACRVNDIVCPRVALPGVAA